MDESGFLMKRFVEGEDRRETLNQKDCFGLRGAAC
jgi:hypothetical protein